MSKFLLFLFCGVTQVLLSQPLSVHITEMASMPVPISNNAVSEGFVGTTPYVYSFAGIDSTKIYSGNTLNSYRYNTVTDSWETIDPVPDTLGKIAVSANRVGDTIYVIGGYHVLANGHEISSNKVHRYNTQSNTWLTDGENIPVPIDDQVQAVWRDSLIYVITGWSNTTNVTNVQIYNPFSNTWSVGTSVPNATRYKLFGAAGTIIEDTIYYFGGAKTGFNFPAGNVLVKGVIDKQNPTAITWTDTIIDPGFFAYRPACAKYHGNAIWIGGSTTTYNYNGIAYNGSGGVEPSGQLIYYHTHNSSSGVQMHNVPMDLRGIANVSESVRYIAGGMTSGQTVSAETFKIEFQDLMGIAGNIKSDQKIIVYPQPMNDQLKIRFTKSVSDNSMIMIYNLLGELVFSDYINGYLATIDQSELPGRSPYFFKIIENNKEVASGKIL